MLYDLHMNDLRGSLRPCLYRLTEDDIKDKSKMSVFAKAIAVILIFRLVISLVAGAVLGLRISQMKIITYRVYRLYSRDLWFLVEETSSNRDPYATYCIFR